MNQTPRPKMTGIYLNAKERKLLEDLAEDAGMTMSAYVRWLLRQMDHDRKTIQVPRKASITEYAQ